MTQPKNSRRPPFDRIFVLNKRRFNLAGFNERIDDLEAAARRESLRDIYRILREFNMGFHREDARSVCSGPSLPGQVDSFGAGASEDEGLTGLGVRPGVDAAASRAACGARPQQFLRAPLTALATALLTNLWWKLFVRGV